MRKYICSIFLAIILTFSLSVMCFAASATGGGGGSAGGTTTIGTVSCHKANIYVDNGSVGDIVTVTVNIPENSNAAGGSFNLEYDNQKMTFVEAKAGYSFGTDTINSDYSSNAIRMNFADSKVISQNGATALVATFMLNNFGEAEFTVENFKLFDVSGNEIPCVDTSKTIKIYSGVGLKPVINADGGKVDDEITVSINMPSGSNAAGGSFNLVYDNAKMELISAEKGTVSSNLTVNPDYAQNKIRINFAGSTAISTNGGTALIAKFRLKESGKSFFAVEQFMLFNTSATQIQCSDAELKYFIDEGANVKSINASVSGSVCTVSISAEDVPLNAKAYVAVYDSNGRFKGMKEVTLVNGTAQTNITASGASMIKALIWNLETLKPYTYVREKTL